jgi:hypothetical protein
VTSSGRRPGASATERKRRQRERDQQPIYETEDWRLFTELATLPQKAGCQPAYLREIVLKELVDNAPDAGARVSLDQAARSRGARLRQDAAEPDRPTRRSFDLSGGT